MNACPSLLRSAMLQQHLWAVFKQQWPRQASLLIARQWFRYLVTSCFSMLATYQKLHIQSFSVSFNVMSKELLAQGC